MFVDEVKYFSLKHAREKTLTFLLLGFTLDHIFYPKKDNLKCDGLIRDLTSKFEQKQIYFF